MITIKREVSDDAITPGARYWSKAYNVFKDGHIQKHDPWTSITSKAEEETLAARRVDTLP